ARSEDGPPSRQGRATTDRIPDRAARTRRQRRPPAAEEQRSRAPWKSPLLVDHRRRGDRSASRRVRRGTQRELRRRRRCARAGGLARYWAGLALQVDAGPCAEAETAPG